MNPDDKWKGCWTAARQAMAEGKVEQAEALLYGTLEIAEDFEPDDQRLIMTLECLAEVIFRQGRFAQAEPVCKRVIMIYERKFGPDHPDVGVFTNNLGLIYHHQKKYFMAETEYQKALALQNRVLGQHHPQTINAMSNYARLLKETHRLAEARHMDALIRGANTPANWTQSGTYKAYVVSAADQLGESVPATTADPMARGPMPVSQGRRGRTQYNQIDENITLQDVALPESLRADSVTAPKQAANSQKEQSQTITGIQKLIAQRKEVCD
ncbi:MAG: tetratricopeptide repeat protein [Cyanobacteria bacterium REEB67]|nr:tetratricopeptide repeat protein [Cyanobacteria bacterium REEB67]